MTEPNDKRVHHEHDVGYRDLLGAKRTFLDWLRAFVNESWVKDIEESSVEKIDRTFIAADYSEKESDLIFKLKIKGEEVYLYILTEFQSSVDYQMPFRLLTYMVEVWRHVLENTDENEQKRKDFRLPAIVPIVVYNGKLKWTVPQQFKEMLDQSERYGNYVVNFQYLFIDTQRYTKEELETRKSVMAAVFYLDKDIEVDKLSQMITEMSENLNNLPAEEINKFFRWFKRIFSKRLSSDLQEVVEEALKEVKNPKEVFEMISNLDKGLKRSFDRLRMEGLLEGEKRGKREGLLEGEKRGKMEGLLEGEKRGRVEERIQLASDMLRDGQSESVVAKYTKLTLEEIKNIRKSLN